MIDIVNSLTQNYLTKASTKNQGNSYTPYSPEFYPTLIRLQLPFSFQAFWFVSPCQASISENKLVIPL